MDNNQQYLENMANMINSLLTSDYKFEDSKVSIWLSRTNELHFMSAGYHKWIDNQNEDDFKSAVNNYLTV
ncbi:hypothetical protein [Lentilactobacillus sp. SPB1-3]|uniref:Uncharacterized protein n=1 Tax=Lentilactobacillus terminaliae TaxID=3003483 RepID=A0ACD5DCT6_9LACO|nr:hypothetical protein [Lentilactobacillus sp. SPB1-3]MCZ0978136.1 hypothetical protein [Lentilactobacillus sp. SPB1-3]